MLYACLDAWTGIVISRIFGFVGLIQNLVQFDFWITLFSSDCLTSLAVNLGEFCYLRRLRKLDHPLFLGSSFCLIQYFWYALG